MFAIRKLILCSSFISLSAFAATPEQSIIAMQQAKIEALTPKVLKLAPVTVKAIDPPSSKVSVDSRSTLTIQKVGIMCTAIGDLQGLKVEGTVYSIGVEIPVNAFKPSDLFAVSAAVYSDWSGTQIYQIFTYQSLIRIYRNNKDVPVSFQNGQSLPFTYTYQCGNS